MIDYLRSIITSENDQDPTFIRLARVVLSIAIAAAVLAGIVQALTVTDPTGWRVVGIIFAIGVFSSVILFFTYRNVLWPVKVLFPLILLAILTYLAINADGLHDAVVAGFTAILIIASLLAGQKAIPLASLLTALAVCVVGYTDMVGINHTLLAQSTQWDEIALISIFQFAAGGVLYVLMARLNFAFENFRANEQSQIKANQELRELQMVLERRVADRTHSLELAADVGRIVSEVGSLDVMLVNAAETIRSRFDLYYTQIYLTTPNQTELVLQAGTGRVGKELIGRRHRLPLNTGSINGRAAVEKQAVVISDVTANLTFRPNPLLPETRSEMAIPLMVGNKVIGVLDLQSRHVGELNQDILPAFNALSGQLAIAVQNATLLSQANQARAEVEAQARRLVRTGWEDYLDAIHKPEHTGYVFEDNKITLLSQPQSAREGAAHTVPIIVGGESLGDLVVEMDDQNRSAQNEELLQAVARLVAQQIENQRLLESAERYRFEAEQASSRLTREGWKEYAEAKGGQSLGYLYNLTEVKPVSQAISSPAQEPAVTLPVKVRDETVGKLTILGLETMDSESLTLANAVAERLGAHIESLRQYDQTQSALTQSEKLFDASRRLTMTTNLQELVQAAVGTLSIAVINRAILGTYSYNAADEMESMTIAANWWNGTGAAAEAVGKYYPADALRRSALLQSSTALFFEDALHDEQADPSVVQFAKDSNSSALAVLPLLLGTRQTGVLILEGEEPHPFTQDEIRLFSALSPQIATVLENRRQFERAQHQADRESMLNVINQKIQAATSVEAVLQIAARELGHALGAPRTIAQLSIKDRK